MILAGAAGAGLFLVAGLAYAGYLALHSAQTGPQDRWSSPLRPEQMNSLTARGAVHRDAIAAQPMLAVPDGAQTPTTPTTRLAGTITVPAPLTLAADDTTINGDTSGGVATGFPHTPQGAVGQLAALGQTVLSAMSVTTAHRVYDDWAWPGGVGSESWRMTENVTAFLGAAGMGASKVPGATVSVVPAAAIVKGTDGPDWVVVCVLLQVDAVVTTRSSIGYGYCERMAWREETGAGPASPTGGRWMIAPGAPPAPAPSTWPGSALAVEAGWLTWTTAPASGTGRWPADPADPADVDAPDNPAGDGAGSSGLPVDPTSPTADNAGPRP